MRCTFCSSPFWLAFVDESPEYLEISADPQSNLDAARRYFRVLFESQATPPPGNKQLDEGKPPFYERFVLLVKMRHCVDSSPSWRRNHRYSQPILHVRGTQRTDSRFQSLRSKRR
ncbi:hypothetical protein BDV26DRAFT_251011 [Aspergillus bertholletiae]|uniref:Uncharacterized protein n=1 Tax=Aspergillus bertholletiae TaxID=1226010 RepID=A0A5N7BQH2_9EURO|nr:hypothetical protein BDV26DRAFT_251011 [Aspergillus bertholletiae]